MRVREQGAAGEVRNPFTEKEGMSLAREEAHGMTHRVEAQLVSDVGGCKCLALRGEKCRIAEPLAVW